MSHQKIYKNGLKTADRCAVHTTRNAPIKHSRKNNTNMEESLPYWTSKSSSRFPHNALVQTNNTG
eukprot:9533538-Ditylum_brightwellii.AAC.1